MTELEQALNNLQTWRDSEGFGAPSGNTENTDKEWQQRNLFNIADADIEAVRSEQIALEEQAMDAIKQAWDALDVLSDFKNAHNYEAVETENTEMLEKFEDFFVHQMMEEAMKYGETGFDGLYKDEEDNEHYMYIADGTMMSPNEKGGV